MVSQEANRESLSRREWSPRSTTTDRSSYIKFGRCPIELAFIRLGTVDRPVSVRKEDRVGNGGDT